MIQSWGAFRKVVFDLWDFEKSKSALCLMQIDPILKSCHILNVQSCITVVTLYTKLNLDSNRLNVQLVAIVKD